MTEINIPESDIELADAYGFRFSILRKDGRRNSWQPVAENLTSLENAINLAQEVDAWEVGVSTSSGIMYWSSRMPDVFGSDVIERGRLVMTFLGNFKLTWDGYLRVKSMSKAELLLRRISKALEREITVGLCEQYWKDKTHYRTVFSLELETNDIVLATFQALQFNGRIANKWEIGTLNQFENGGWGLSGTATRGKIPGVELINFHLHNWETRYVKGPDETRSNT